jgi:hypothetical protein
MVVGIGKFEDEIFLGHLSCIVFNLCALYYALEKKNQFYNAPRMLRRWLQPSRPELDRS